MGAAAVGADGCRRACGAATRQFLHGAGLVRRRAPVPAALPGRAGSRARPAGIRQPRPLRTGRPQRPPVRRWWTPPRRAAYRPSTAPGSARRPRGRRRLGPAAPAVDLPPANLTMPPLPDPKNVYAGIAAGNISPATAGALSRVYAPNLTTGRVDVIDPATFKVVDSYFAVPSPQHIVPSWDLQTLWVSGDISYTGGHAYVAPIDPKTGKVGKPISVPDSYNMYFTPDGRSAIIVAEAKRRLEFRDPEDDGAAELHRRAGLRRHQPRRFRARRLLRDLHLRVQRQARQDRSRPPQARRHAATVAQAHPAGHPRRARRLRLLRRRHAGRRPARHRRRQVQRDRLHPDRRRRARPLSRAATARSSTSPTAAPTSSPASRTARAASR